MSNDAVFFRSVALSREQLDDQDRSIDLSFSSEQPYRRWYGDEILLHGEDNINLDRLRSMGSCLLNHNADRIVGSVSQVRIDNKRGLARISFDNDALGDMAKAKVKSGSLRGVSVGYIIDEAIEINKGETRDGVTGPALLATRWTPFEISLTPIPADASVGVARSLDAVNIINRTRRQHMTKEEIAQIIEERLERLVSELGLTLSPADAPLPEPTPDGLAVPVAKAQELLTQAGIVGDGMKARVAEMLFAGESAERIYREIITGAVKYDARDIPGPAAAAPAPALPDADFFNGLKNPASPVL